MEVFFLPTPHKFLKTDSGESDMLYGSFVEQYMNAIGPHLKEDTLVTKNNIFKHHILPYFGKRKLNEIEPIDVANWQKEIMKKSSAKGKPLSSVYLKTIHNQLSASFNFAVRFYHLPKNPAAIAGNMGKEGGKEMLFWTKRAPGLLDCISLCKLRNYYKDGGSIVVTDKDFNELERSPLPARFDGCNTNLVKMWISPGEKYGFFACQGMSILFDLAKRRTVREFDYDFIDEFTMVNDDTTFIISTWDGSYIGNI